jgi:hypothetical protein
MEIKKPLEKDIQREICEYLNDNKYFFWRSNNIPVFGMNNGGKKTFRSLPKFTPRGIPDIILLHNSKFIGFEVKRPGEKLRPEQITFQSNCHGAGCDYYVVYCLNDVKKALIEMFA